MPPRHRASFLTLLALSLFTVSVDAQVARPPVVEHLEPTSGPTGSVLHVVGRRFGPGATVHLGELALESVQVMPNRLVVRVPHGARSGRLEIRTPAGGRTVGPYFRVTPRPAPPTITSFAPAQGPPGTEVRVVGTHFAPRLTGNVVTIAGERAVVKRATPLELLLTVPDLKQGGPLVVRVQHAGEARSAEAFAISAPMAVRELLPPAAPAGSEVLIRGAGFDPQPGNNRVYVHGTALKVTSASGGELRVLMPKALVPGPVLVDVRGGGRVESGQALRLQPMPEVDAVAPRSAAPGATVRVSGKHFGRDRTAVRATLGDTELVVRSVTPTEVELELPPKPQRGTLAVRVHGVGPATAKRPYEVIAPLRLVAFSPAAGPAGSEVLISGEGFAARPLLNRVTIGGKRARVLEASPTQLRVRIPGARSGAIRVRLSSGAEAATTRPFVITVPPRVRTVSPRHGPVGTELTIRGRGFGSSTAVLQVRLGEARLEVRSVRDDEAVVRVPPGAKSGRLEVAVPLQGSHELEWEFRVEAPE